MYVHLRKGNGNALLIEGQFNLLLHVQEHRPVVPRLHPRAHNNIQRAIGQLSDGDKHLRLFQDALVVIDYGSEHAFGLEQIGVIAYAEDHINAAGFTG